MPALSRKQSLKHAQKHCSKVQERTLLAGLLGHQCSSRVIKGHQCSSRVISSHQPHLLAGLLGGDALKSSIPLALPLPLGSGCSQLCVGSLSKLL